MTVVEQILLNAESYPDRLAIVSTDGTEILYGDLAKHLSNVTEYQHFTSGTTGRNKQIVITDENLQRRLSRLEVVRPSLVNVSKLFVPIPRELPLYTQLRSYILLNGKTFFDLGELAPAEAMGLCSDYGVDGSVFIPKNPMFEQLLGVGGDHRFAHVFVSGASASLKLLTDISGGYGASVHINYAASEVGQIAGGDLSEIGEIENCVGRVAPDVLVEIVDGNVRVQCDTMVEGYVDDPYSTKARFHDGFFYPGDIGHFDGEFLVITGRV
jgi:acyl-CoA synthetase (AMP-forming)/AMP-acid ligase II